MVHVTMNINLNNESNDYFYWILYFTLIHLLDSKRSLLAITLWLNFLLAPHQKSSERDSLVLNCSVFSVMISLCWLISPQNLSSNFCSTSDNRYLNMERLHDIETIPALESSRPGPKSSRMLWARAGYLTSSCSIFKWVKLYCKRDTIMYVATGGASGKEPTC